MKTISILPDLSKHGITLPADKPVSEVFLEWIVSALLSAHPDGLSFKEQRMLYKVLDKIEIAFKELKETVELEDAEYELLKEAFKTAKLPITSCKVVNLFYDIFELV